VSNVSAMDLAQRRGRGRPVTTDPGAVGLSALRLFSERGIDNVTMDDVAEALNLRLSGAECTNLTLSSKES